MSRRYLILEFSEFDLQRFGETESPQAENPNLSHGAFDKHIDQVKQSQVRLNDIMQQLRSTNNIFGPSGIIDGLDIEQLKVIRIYPQNVIDLKIYLSFVLDGKEYFGEITNFISHPHLNTEAFRDPNLLTSKEWKIKLEGLLIKTINKWMQIDLVKWKTLKDIPATNRTTGAMIVIPEGDIFKVTHNLDSSLLINYQDQEYEISGMNYYYFNYWCEKV